jgi:hypothetical protein
MESVKIAGVLLVRRWERELPVDVHVDNTFGVGDGFGEREASILYNRDLAERSQVPDRLGGRMRLALV